VPSLVKLFTALKVNLPLATRALIAAAHFFMNYKFELVTGLIVLVAFIIWLWKLPAFKRVMDRIIIKVPVAGSIIITRNLCRFCRTGSMLVEAGMSLPQSLNAIIGIIDNSVIKQVFVEIRQDIIKGKGFSRQMSKYPIFPKLLVDVIGIGEKTGTLKESFTSMADYYEKRLDLRVKKLLAMIEPGSIILVGLIISYIGVAIIQPLYSIYQGFH
jgi:type II secretory pathway component PulF